MKKILFFTILSLFCIATTVNAEGNKRQQQTSKEVVVLNNEIKNISNSFDVVIWFTDCDGSPTYGFANRQPTLLEFIQFQNWYNANICNGAYNFLAY